MAENKTKAVQIRMTEEQYETIRGNAEKLGMNMSQYLIFSAMNDNMSENFQTLKSEVTTLTSVVERLSVAIKDKKSTDDESVADLLRKGGFADAAEWLELMS